MKLTAKDLYEFGIVEGILSEEDPTEEVRKAIKTALCDLKEKTKEEIVSERYEKFRKFDAGFLKNE